MRINGLVYAIVGIFVAATSFFVFKGNQQLLFYIVGGAFITFGLLKLLIDKVREPKYEQQEPEKRFKAKQEPQGRLAIGSNQHKYCWRCRALVNRAQNFCHNCGAQLR
ncbi:hypothetical protein HYV81_00760 [Candidatus Woesearchaeota archaeon]|nr:hypothetical protein [Candidatus Woesearchaeota archaeon]